MELPIKDKLAVVFHGIIGGMGGRNGLGPPANISDCAKTIKYNVLSTYDCDIFAHSWSIDHANDIKLLYNPISSLFEPQEYFGYSGIYASDSPEAGQPFRTISRYTSLERAMRLKQDYEKTNGFRYKWVLISRYDIVFLTRLNLSLLDPKYMYICEEPHWPKGKISLFHDIVFLSNSNVMDEYSKLGQELRNGQYNKRDAHSSAYRKLMSMFNNNLNMIQYGFRRYTDVETYRQLMHPETNPVGHAYGALECKKRLEELLFKIDNEKSNE